MATYTSEQASDQDPAVSGDGFGEVIAVRGVIDLADAGVALALNDILRMVKLPPDHEVVDVIVDSDDLDSNGTPLITVEAGVIGGDTNAFITADTVARAGGLVRMNAIEGLRLGSSTAERYLGLTVSAAPATGTTTGKIGMTVLYKPI